jgi:hypothetical protein
VAASLPHCSITTANGPTRSFLRSKQQATHRFVGGTNGQRRRTNFIEQHRAQFIGSRRSPLRGKQGIAQTLVVSGLHQQGGRTAAKQAVSEVTDLEKP